VIALIYSAGINLALGVQGPYDQVVEGHSKGYVRLSRWLGPSPFHRLMLDPRLAIEALYEFPAAAPGLRVPLAAAGRFGSRYLLSAEMLGGDRVRLVSTASPTSGNTASADVTLPAGAPVRVRLEYVPETHRMLVEWNGVRVIQHELKFLVTAPGQVTVGEDRSGITDAPEYFPGKVTLVRLAVDRTR